MLKQSLKIFHIWLVKDLEEVFPDYVDWPKILYEQSREIRGEGKMKTGRGWRDVAISKGMPMVTRNWKRQVMNFP